MDITKVDLTVQNAFHCSTMFLKAVWDYGIRYKPELAFGVRMNGFGGNRCTGRRSIVLLWECKKDRRFDLHL
jgi:hypothetical protein